MTKTWCPLGLMTVSLALAAGGPAVRAVDAPAKADAKPASAVQKPDPASVKAKAAAVNQAVVALQKEYQAHLKDEKKPVREKSDYFKDNPSPDATPEAILKALEQSVSGGPAVEGYVKWQLLSAVPGKWPDDLVPRAVKAYHRAPMPVEHPGLNRQQLNRAKSGLKKEDLAGANKEFDAVLAQAARTNDPVIAYRNEMYSRLPTNYDAIYAGLEDLAERASHGLNVNGLFDNLAASIRSWALTGAKSGQTRAMADKVAQIKQAVGSDDLKPYTQLTYDDKKKAVNWKADGVLDPKKCDALIKFLDEQASSPLGGGLKFKDSK